MSTFIKSSQGGESQELLSLGEGEKGKGASLIPFLEIKVTRGPTSG